MFEKLRKNKWVVYVPLPLKGLQFKVQAYNYLPYLNYSYYASQNISINSFTPRNSDYPWFQLSVDRLVATTPVNQLYSVYTFYPQVFRKEAKD